MDEFNNKSDAMAIANALYWECRVVEEFFEKTLNFNKVAILSFSPSEVDKILAKMREVQ